MQQVFGAEERQVKSLEHEGKRAHATVSTRTYATTVEELWEAISNPERLARFFAPVRGEFRPGGRYQIEGNAEGTIERCDPREALDLSWEFAGTTSWVRIRLAPVEGGARLRLEHLAHETEAGRAFIRESGEAWAAAHIAAGADPEEARAMAERTIAFYTGGA